MKRAQDKMTKPRPKPGRCVSARARHSALSRGNSRRVSARTAFARRVVVLMRCATRCDEMVLRRMSRLTGSLRGHSVGNGGAGALMRESNLVA